MARKLVADVPEIKVPRRWLDALELDRRAGAVLACELAQAIADSGTFDGVHLIPGVRYRETASHLEEHDRRRADHRRRPPPHREPGRGAMLHLVSTSERPLPSTADRIIGRRRELDALAAWVDAARLGRGRLVLCAGEPGIGKTRLAQELAGATLAGGAAVAWGRCVEAEGRPAFWPWRQVLRSLGIADAVLSGEVGSPEDRFRVSENVSQAVCGAAGSRGLVVILDDIHWADEPSLLVLRHLADHIAGASLLLMATFRQAEPSGALPRVLPDLLRSPGVERLDLGGFGRAEVCQQLLQAGADEGAADAGEVLDLTGGNPLFVREIARAMAEGTWRADRPPRSVLDVVTARLDRASAGCRRFVQAAAIAGRDFSLPLVAAALRETAAGCLPAVDEAVAFGLVEKVGDAGDYRFVHALTREAVEASLTTAEQVALHRVVAEATEATFAGVLSEHLSDIARHWSKLAPYGEASTARAWAVRAGDEAVRRLAYEEGARQYRAALALDPTSMPARDRCRILVALGRAAYFAGDLRGCVDAAAEAADTARAADSPTLMAEASLVLSAVADPAVNAVTKRLCEQALDRLGDTGHEALRARLFAQRSHLAFYEGDEGAVEALSAAAFDRARSSGDDISLVEALHARKEACPGPGGRAERLVLAGEMMTIAARTNTPRTEMWGRLWRAEALIERGELAAAVEELPGLQVAVERVGGPVSAWHLDRVAACIAQAQGRYPDAVAIGRRGFERMAPLEPAPARGGYFALLCALAGHFGVSPDAAPYVEHPFQPLARFTTLGPLARSFLLLCAGLPEEAEASYERAGPLDRWSLPAFYFLVCYSFATRTAAELGRHADLAVLVERLSSFRGEHAAGDGVVYMGPVELTLGRGWAALGDLDRAVDDLAAGAGRADRAGARAFAAEARYHLATALLARDAPGDAEQALTVARDADRLSRALDMTPYVERTAALLAHLEGTRRTVLSPREAEVAKLVQRGLTNRQIAQQLVISERTAQNHVQHILTKLGFTTRSQIAAWSAGVPQMSSAMSHHADSGTGAGP